MKIGWLEVLRFGLHRQIADAALQEIFPLLDRDAKRDQFVLFMRAQSRPDGERGSDALLGNSEPAFQHAFKPIPANIGEHGQSQDPHRCR